MPSIRWSHAAIDDILNIQKYISRDSPEIAEEFTLKIIEFVEHLETLPNLGKKIQKYNDPKIRMIIYRNYNIIYQIYEEFLEIVRIIHQSQDLK